MTRGWRPGWRLAGSALLAGALMVGCGTSVSPPEDRSLRVSDNGRYLLDRAGQPWLMSADTAWTILAKLTRPQIEQYLDGRRANGFNTVAISLVDLTQGGLTGSGTESGEPMFVADTAEPNPGFFTELDAFLDAADERGMTVMIVPMWLNFADKDSRFTVDNMTRFGTFLGERYRSRPNVIWVMGGDFGAVDGEQCPRQDEVRALARAIDQADSRHLMTYHSGADLSTSACYPNDDWVDFNSTYWDFNDQNLSSAYRNVLRDYAVDPPRPVVMLESGYEGPHPDDPDPNALTARTSRLQTYDMVLAGGLGFTYGANSTYFTDNASPTAARTWQDTLVIPGAVQQGLAAAVMREHEWWRLVPDQDHAVVVDGYGTWGEQDYALTGRADDGSFTLTYLPTARPVVVDLSRLRGPTTARWYDPTSGEYRPAADDALANTGTHEFVPPMGNHAGDDDWVLVLEAPAEDP